MNNEETSEKIKESLTLEHCFDSARNCCNAVTYRSGMLEPSITTNPSVSAASCQRGRRHGHIQFYYSTRSCKLPVRHTEIFMFVMFYNVVLYFVNSRARYKIPKLILKILKFIFSRTKFVFLSQCSKPNDQLVKVSIKHIWKQVEGTHDSFLGSGARKGFERTAKK